MLWSSGKQRTRGDSKSKSRDLNQPAYLTTQGMVDRLRRKKFVSIDPEPIKESMVAVLHNTPDIAKYTKIEISKSLNLINLYQFSV